MGKLFKRDRSPFYWADYVDHAGRRQRKSTGCRDKTNAAKVLSKLESDTALLEHGVKSPVADCAKEPLSKHLDDYETTLKAKRTGKYALETRRQIDAVAEFAKWVRLGDLDSEGLEDWIVHLRDEGRGARTVNAYVTALRMFAKWCIDRRRMLVNPFATVKKLKIESDRKYCRRMLLPNEWPWLSRATLESDVIRNGLDGRQRRLLYWLAIESGLRANELFHLTKSSLKLTGNAPHVIAAAHTTKNGETAQQFISDGLASALASYVAHKLPAAELFPIRNRLRFAEMITADLEDARLLWIECRDKSDAEKKNPYFLLRENADRQVFDFHSLRHTCGAWLVMQGVGMKEVQAIMRHSSIKLTGDTYGHLQPDAKARNRSKLEAILEA